MSETLPIGWESTTLGEIGQWSSGGTPLRSNPDFFGGSIPWVKTGDLNDDILTDIEEAITPLGLDNSAAKLFPPGTLLVAMYGATIGKTGVLLESAATNQACAALMPSTLNRDLIPFIWRYLRSRQNELKSIGQGGAQPNISQTILKEFPVPLPPLAEQKRIVTKLDALLARSTRARDELAHIPRLIERYKQAVLAAAFAVYSNRPKASIKELSSFVTSGSRGWAKFYSTDGSLFIRVANVQRGSLSLDFSDTQHVNPPPGSEGTRTRLQPGDIVITITADLGRIGVVPDTLTDAYVNQHVALVRLFEPGQARFIGWFLSSPLGQFQLLEKDRGMTRSGLGLDDIRSVEVPLLSPIEQGIVVERLQTTFKAIDQMEAELTKAEGLRSRLEQATLAKAFRGDLVPQDPSDEPASVLLERIRAERAANENQSGRRRRRQ